MDILDIYSMTDQPEKCRKCGTRTEWKDTESGQVHTCPVCGYKYLLEEEDDEPERNTDTCYFCGQEFDESECVPADPFNCNNGGSACPKCVQELLKDWAED